MNYDNSRQDLYLHWEAKERIFSPGTYVIELYIDGNLRGATSYVMK